VDLFFGQFVAGLSTGSTLFLLSAGLTLIFGVTRIVNFAHGSLFMVGAYAASTLTDALPATPLGFFGGVLLAAAAVGVLGIVIEVVALRRIYRAPEIFQLLATFGLVLVLQDAVLMAWGPQERFAPRAPGLAGSVEIFGAFIPQYTLFLIAVGPLVYAVLAWLLRRTRWGVWIRASAQDREMAGALGIPESMLFTSVFALGAFLAGLAGALQIPRETVNLQMDMAILVEAFVVVVVGGLGSVTGALVASFAIGLLHAFGTWWLPQSTLVLVFVVMAIVLIIRPHGLLGRTAAAQPGRADTHPPFTPLGRPWRLLWLALLAAAALLPFAAGDYAVVIATEIAIAALLAASLHFAMGLGGIVSFGHAAFFGIGAYAVALAIRAFDLPFVVAFIGGPLAAAASGLAIGFVVLRSAGVYAAMLTLAFAQILWSAAVQWVDVTGGDNGILGLWSTLSPWLASRFGTYWFALAVVAASLFALRHAAVAPFGFSVRAARDSALRAEALGIDVGRVRWLAFAAGGAFGGLAGALHALQKGGVFPTTLSIPVSVDALIMVLLGGLHTLSGPIVGALAYHGLSTELVRATEHWRLVLGFAIVLLVVLFPGGIVGFARDRVERSRA
jgi:branched-chain amino acid transport system permease protein